MLQALRSKEAASGIRNVTWRREYNRELLAGGKGPKVSKWKRKAAKEYNLTLAQLQGHIGPGKWGCSRCLKKSICESCYGNYVPSQTTSKRKSSASSSSSSSSASSSSSSSSASSSSSSSSRRRSKRRRINKIQLELNPGDVVVMTGDPVHQSKPMPGSRIVALFFYKIREGAAAPSVVLEKHAGAIPGHKIYTEAIKNNFDKNLSQESFGAKKWNNITNYTFYDETRRAKRKVNLVLQPHMETLRAQVEKALGSGRFYSKTNRRGTYELVEQFVNWYDKKHKSTRSGIDDHQDGTDMSIVVQLENSGKFECHIPT
jgi:hypothetical protein